MDPRWCSPIGDEDIVAVAEEALRIATDWDDDAEAVRARADHGRDFVSRTYTRAGLRSDLETAFEQLTAPRFRRPAAFRDLGDALVRPDRTTRVAGARQRSGLRNRCAGRFEFGPHSIAGRFDAAPEPSEPRCHNTLSLRDEQPAPWVPSFCGVGNGSPEELGERDGQRRRVDEYRRMMTMRLRTL